MSEYKHTSCTVLATQESEHRLAILLQKFLHVANDTFEQCNIQPAELLSTMYYVYDRQLKR